LFETERTGSIRPEDAGWERPKVNEETKPA
jgi:hypothetical protein